MMLKKSLSVLSIMYGMDVMVWSVTEIDTLERVQNKYAGVKAIRGDMVWICLQR